MMSLSIILAILIGLIVGSFLNVVITRLPVILERRWKQDCQLFLKLPVEKFSVFNLWLPQSHCPQCQTPIKIRHNIPVLSYLFLKGRCSACQKSIPLQYVIVEILTALLTVTVVYYFGLTGQMGAYLILTWVLIALFFIDLRKQILPDALTLSTLWLGLFLSLFYWRISPAQAILGAILGYIVLWIFGSLYRLIRKKEGMGHGDYKMLAMLGAWLGPMMLFNILLLSIVLGLLVSIILLWLKKISAKNPIPFGPFIAAAAWISLFTGPIFIQLIWRGM